MDLTDEQKKELEGWGIDPKTIQPKELEIKKLPQPTTPVLVQKNKSGLKKSALLIVLGIIIGAGLIILAVQFNVSSQVTTVNNCISGMEQSFTQGAETLLIQIMNESLQCNQIPINYANYSYNLIAIECLQGVQNG